VITPLLRAGECGTADGVDVTSDEPVKTSCLQESRMHQWPGLRAMPPIAVIGAAPGSAVREFWRNELICKNPDGSMRQASRRTPASRSPHGLPPSAAVLAKQSQCVDPADAHLLAVDGSGATRRPA